MLPYSLLYDIVSLQIFIMGVKMPVKKAVFIMYEEVIVL